jgi:tetratricopeptide (TPR) repeat protein
LRSKYNFDEAAEDYQAALRINPNLPAAQVGLGLIALEKWAFEEVEVRVEAALKINPRCVEALNLKARSKIVERRYDDAIQACQQALEVNPNDLDALSLAAAAHRCKYDLGASRRFEERALVINPRCARLYGILGDALSGLRQYADSEVAYLKSIEFEPTDPNPRTELGLMYMQWGEEAKARQALEAAWKLDEFNERTDNTLQLLEKLQLFTRLETDHFIILYDESEDWPVASYLSRAAEEIYEDVCGDYEADLARKTIVEVLPTHRDFGVRITGKPWIHTVGACTGWVIAMDSPRPGPGTFGPYHYARVLRHEFTHTVTLALTRNRISHWYTEGLAVSSEDQPRSFVWKQLLADAVRRDCLFTLESIDWGFVRPQRPNDRQLAYAQSEWMVEYIVHKYGYDALMGLLEAYDAAKPQDEVFREVLGVEATEFDGKFAAWARSEAAGWGLDLTPPEDPAELRAEVRAAEDDAALRGRLAKAELDAGNLPEATEAAAEALDLDDNEVNALRVMVEAHNLAAANARTLRERELAFEQVRPHLERLAEVDPDDWVAPQLLGELALGDRQYDQAEGWFKRVKRLCPENPAGYRGLAAIYLQRGQTDAAQPVLFELARMEERDADVPADLAAIFARKDRLGEARYWYRESLHIDPFNPKTHRRLAEVLMRLGDTKEALGEYEALCRLEPGRAQNFADAAFAYRKTGDNENAKRCAGRAVELDPTSPARTLLDTPPED